MFWGRFTIRRQNAGRRELGVLAGEAGAVVEEKSFEINLRVPMRHIPALRDGANIPGNEYYFQSKKGLLAIVPHRELPSAVELYIRGQGVGATYLSADFRGPGGRVVPDQSQRIGRAARCRPAGGIKAIGNNPGLIYFRTLDGPSDAAGRTNAAACLGLIEEVRTSTCSSVEVPSRTRSRATMRSVRIP